MQRSVLVQERAQFAFRRPAGQSRLAARRACSTVCMAHPRRVAKVAKQIEREVGNLLITDKLLQQAVCPERRRGFDGAISALASVTEVQISNDLQVAKVYLSIYSDDMGKAVAMEGLQKLEGYVRRHIGKQIRLRLTPEIRFVRDDSIERSERIFKLLDQVKKIERGEAEPPPLAFYGDDEFEYGSDEDEDEEDLGGYGGAFEIVDLGMFGDTAPQQPSSSSSSSSAAPRQGGRAPRSQQARASGKQQQQQQQGSGNKKSAAADEGDEKFKDFMGEAEDGDFEAMLATFKQQAEQRRKGQR